MSSNNGTTTSPRLKELYKSELRAALKDELGLTNIMQVPTLEKIVINVGVGAAVTQGNVLEGALADITIISGQKAVSTRAKTSISNFKLREGTPIGVKSTLRGNMMWEFYDRLTNLAIPRVRDFRGLSLKSFDGHGNYTMGITEQLIFPEIDFDSINGVRGMDITIVTTAKTDEECEALLRALGFPLRERDNLIDKPVEQAPTPEPLPMEEEIDEEEAEAGKEEEAPQEAEASDNENNTNKNKNNKQEK